MLDPMPCKKRGTGKKKQEKSMNQTSVRLIRRSDKKTRNFMRYDNPDSNNKIMNNAYIGKSAFDVPEDQQDDVEAYPDSIDVTISWE